METQKIIAAILIVALVVSVGFNIRQFTENANLTISKTELNTQYQIATLLAQMQTQINFELQKLAVNLQNASRLLSAVGLQGEAANRVLTELNANDSYIINSATADLNDVIAAVEPSSYSSIVGANISNQTQNIQLHQTFLPAMSGIIRLVEGFDGVVMVSPIFDSAGALMGSLSIVIQTSQLLKDQIAPKIGDTPFTCWVIQTDGKILYDQNATKTGQTISFSPTQIGNLTTSGRGYLRNLARSTTGTFTYIQTLPNSALGDFTYEQVTWNTVGVYGVEWRLGVVRETSF
jgi:hypothetical protein